MTMICAWVAAGGKNRGGRFVKEDEADRVLLADEHHGERDDHGGAIIELGKRGAAPVVHRVAGVDDEGDADVALFLVLLDVMPVRPREDAPVEPAKIVAGGVLAVLGELDVEAVKRAAMLTADRTFDQPARPQDQVGNLGDGVRVGIFPRRRHWRVLSGSERLRAAS